VRVKALLAEHMDKLHTVARALLEKERLEGAEFEEIFSNGFTSTIIAPIQ
jgi:cell division protease FtsH